MTDSNKAYKSIFDLPEMTAEEVVEPHSFRNSLLRALCYTAIVPIFMLGLFQLQQFQRATKVADEAQLALTQSISWSITSTVDSTEKFLRILSEEETPNLRGFLNRFFAHSSREVSVVGVFSANGALLSLCSASGTPVSTETIGILNKIRKAGQSGDVFFSNDAPFSAQIGLVVRNETNGRSVVALIPNTFLLSTLHRLCGDQSFNVAVWDANARAIVQIGQSDPAIVGELTPENRRQLLASADGIMVRTPGTRDVSQSIAYNRISDLHWLISVGQPLKARDEAMMASLETSGFFLILSVILSFFVGFWMNRPINRSLQTLIEAVETFGKGGRFRFVQPRLEKEGITDFIELGKRFEKMADMVSVSQRKLERLNARLEDLVDKRTAALRSRNRELRTLQKLLLPMQQGSRTRKAALKAHLSASIRQFRKFLHLNDLRFISNSKAGSVDPGKTAVSVELSSQIYGRLVSSDPAAGASDRVASLRRLANSMAIVLANEALLTQLDKEHTTLAIVFESMTDGVIVFGRSGRIIYATRYAEQLINDGGSLLGIYGKEHLQKLYGKIVPEDTQGQHIRLVRRSATGKMQTLDVVGFKVVNLPGFPGERCCWLVRDISREAGIEAMKENLVSVAAHELKTPVTAIRLLTETLKKDIQAGRLGNLQDLQELMDETLRLGQLVDDILDVSRIEGGVMQLDKRVVQVASLIDRAARLVAVRYPVEVKREIEPEAEVIKADPLRLTQVFINLFVNAARYRKETQNTASCLVKVRQGANSTVVISVTDSGKGIEADRIGRIFEPFYQADMSTRRTEGGAGLGLTIVKGITEAHHGEISVASTPGKETTFTLVLPAY
ncbi:MAG TPA: hypothetical protein DD376_05725 [Sutterella sp.]|nr:hypothetical protein [Sutterella sp.]